MTVVALPRPPAAVAVPERFADFRDRHRGETVIVCGCGTSLALLERPERFVTIGVNDVGRLFTPDYLVVVNERRQFDPERYVHIEQSRAKAIFTQLDLPHERAVRFRLGRRSGTDRSDPECLHYTNNSPYVAMDLARHLGAQRIGLIGVDFTDDHFFARTGAHPLARQLAQIEDEYKRLDVACRGMGIEVYNLSPISRLTAFPRMSFAAFAQLACKHPPDRKEAVSRLRIVSYATTPIAGVPAILARCIAARTPHWARCVWATNDYGNGVAFAGDIEWSRDPAAAERALTAADLVIVHNGKVEPRHRPLLGGKAVVTMAHNYMWNVDDGFVRQGFPGVVVGQYQATLPEFARWTPVPNPLPFWEPDHQPGAKDPTTVTVCYTPSGRHGRYPPDHRLYWHSKGYDATIAALRRLAARVPLRLEVIGDRQISHAEALAMKHRAHIVIDECVTGSYHRNSLEGLACGCVVINGVGRLHGVADVFRHCALEAADVPFEPADLDTLERVLQSLVEKGPAALEEAGRRNRSWFERHWDFTRQWDRYWQPSVAEALGRVPRRVVSSACVSERAVATERNGGVTVIVPHGGAERKPLLRACLSELRRCSGVGEVIVAEMDEGPLVRDVAGELADGYIFLSDRGGFHKARVINAALPLAGRDLVLWVDNDLLLPEAFLPAAIKELRDRNLDCLVPWTSVRYLSREDSTAVMQGKLAAPSCRPVQSFWSRRGACGGAVLLRRDFLRVYGGLCEEFRGWGGEDNAWYYKAGLLGRAAATSRTDQHLYHLYHQHSGGYGAEQPGERNAGYAANFALLKEIRALRTADRFVARFPPPRHAPCPWPADRRIGIVTGKGEEADRILTAVADGLGDAYGAAASLDNSGQPDITLSCETATDSGRPMKVVVSRPSRSGEITWEEVPLDDESLITDPKRLLMKLVGPISVLLADVHSAPTSRMKPDSPRQALSIRKGSSVMKLNLGCCDAVLDGYVNVDIVEAPGVQVQADLRQPWPWPDSSVDFIRAHDIIEHLPNKIFTMNEMWRVLKEGCQAQIVVPTTDGPGAFQDPTHVSFWHRRSFLYYEAGNPYRERFARAYGILARFRVVREQVDMTQDGPKLTISLAATKS